MSLKYGFYSLKNWRHCVKVEGTNSNNEIFLLELAYIFKIFDILGNLLSVVASQII